MVSETPGLQSRNDLYELEVLDGLGQVCREELTLLLAQKGRVTDCDDADRIAFEYSGERRNLCVLTTAVAVFQLLYFKVPRPQGIFQGGQGLKFFDCLEEITKYAAFRSFRIGAAGSDSPAFEKIKKLIAQRSGLKNDQTDGDLVIRFRRSRLKNFGWDVLFRLTPLPLSARSWRTANLPGALNATIAAAMLRLVKPAASDRMLNLMCGSGTFMAERAASGHGQASVGIDISIPHLRMAQANLVSSAPRPALAQADATRLPFADASFSVLFSDFPWGRRVGKGEELASLYENSLREAARICVPGGKFGVITQENALLDTALEAQRSLWSVGKTLRVNQADYRPKIYVLQRL